MFDYIKQFYDLIFDTDKSWAVKTAKIIITITLVLFVDLTLNLSYDLHTSNKLSQLEKITALKKVYKDTPENVSELVRMESDVLKKEHYSEYLSRKFSQIFLIQEAIVQKSSNESETNRNDNTKTIIPIRSIYWMALSSNAALLFAIIAMLFLSISYVIDGEKDVLSGAISIFVILCLMVVAITWIAYQIPVIMGKPYLNYILNFLIQFLFIIFIMKKLSNSSK
ncbi:hypothetical protein [Aquimarina macrocephali]|uniref:hypothetical protein n=1 Tax=Aquimarina macrocephali TaxID=666563 RepID=UPI003F6750CC